LPLLDMAKLLFATPIPLDPSKFRQSVPPEIGAT